MAHPLDGCRAKLDRANELIISLESELRSYLLTDPKPYKIEGVHRNDDREFQFTAFGNMPPMRFSVLAGEIIHHLRSSLDHIVWALAARKNAAVSERLQFPICKTKAGYDQSTKNGAIKGVGDAAAKIIESLQPFKQPSPGDTLLSALHQASITDKHRLLLVVAAVAQLGEKITVGDAPDRKSMAANDVAIVGLSSPAKVKITEQGETVFTIFFREPSPQVVAHAEFDVSISFDELGEARNVELIKGLRALHAGSAHTVGLFSGIF